MDKFVTTYDAFADVENGLLPYLAESVRYLLRESDVEGLQKLIDDMAFVSDSLYDLIEETAVEKQEFDQMMNKRKALEDEKARQDAAREALETQMAKRFGVKTSKDKAEEEAARRAAEEEEKIKVEAERIAEEKLAAAQQAAAAATGLVFDDPADELDNDDSELIFEDPSPDDFADEIENSPADDMNLFDNDSKETDPFDEFDDGASAFDDDPFAEIDRDMGLGDVDVDNGYQPVDDDPFDFEPRTLEDEDEGLPGDLVLFGDDVNDELHIDEYSLESSSSAFQQDSFSEAISKPTSAPSSNADAFDEDDLFGGTDNEEYDMEDDLDKFVSDDLNTNKELDITLSEEELAPSVVPEKPKGIFDAVDENELFS